MELSPQVHNQSFDENAGTLSILTNRPDQTTFRCVKTIYLLLRIAYDNPECRHGFQKGLFQAWKHISKGKRIRKYSLKKSSCRTKAKSHSVGQFQLSSNNSQIDLSRSNILGFYSQTF